jgi:DNA-binding IclR family transcriptional regulator
MSEAERLQRHRRKADRRSKHVCLARFLESALPASSSTKTAKANAPRIRQVPAVSRALAILRLLAARGEPLTLKAIADELQLVTSTCLHILRVLVDEGMVKVEPSNKRYTLDVGVLALARSVVESNPFPARVQAALDRLSESWNVTTIGVKAAGLDDLVVLALARSRGPFQLYVEVGSRVPPLTSATGRLVAAYAALSDAELARRFKGLVWENAPDFDTWKKEVRAVERKGYAIDRGNYISGVSVIAAPILDAQRHMTHALVALAVTDQLTGARAQAVAADLIREAQALS